MRVMHVGRPVETVRFVARVYRTLHTLKRRGITPREAGQSLAGEAGSMGPLYTKLAQFLSARKDVLDGEFVEALAEVQDNVSVSVAPEPPELPGYEVDPVPIARASIADVYVGRRREDGLRVAIKQRRAGIKRQMTEDLPLLSGVMFAAGLAGVPGAQNMYELIAQSRELVLRELDFRIEGAAMDEFRALFGGLRWLVVPRVVSASETLLVTEFEPSRKCTAVAGANPALAQRVMDLYMLMLGKGFVHADPHPGNLGFRPNGDVVLYDFGAMLRVEAGVRERVARALEAGVKKDAEGLVGALEDLGVLAIQPGQRPAVRQLMRRALNGNLHEELRDAPEFASRNRRVVRLGTTFIYLTRTLTLIDGMCRTLDPEFDYDFSRWVEVPGGVEAAMEVLRDAASLPSTLTTMQTDMEDFQARVVGEMAQLKRAVAVGLGAAAVYAAVCAALGA